jgi:hypothetical protein
MIEGSGQLSSTIPAESAKRPCVSLVIDERTIERRHFLDIMVLAPSSRLPPFLTAEDHRSLVAQAIEQLTLLAVKV